MFPDVDTSDSVAVETVVDAIYRDMFEDADEGVVATAFNGIRDCFEGKLPGYQAIDAAYHDLEHTMQGTLCMVRVLEGRGKAEAKPILDRRLFELGLQAMLLHDTGYLKKDGDKEGTGAKYTLTHVTRSVLFAEEYLTAEDVSISDIRSVQNMIRCTGVHVDFSRVPFHSELEKIVGFCLGTGDLLGQMSAGDYIDKLPILYKEFEESAKFYEGRMISTLNFTSVDDLTRKTPGFWGDYVKSKLVNDFWSVHRFLCQPYPGGPNPYVEKVDSNIARLRDRLAKAEG